MNELINQSIEGLNDDISALHKITVFFNLQPRLYRNNHMMEPKRLFCINVARVIEKRDWYFFLEIIVSLAFSSKASITEMEYQVEHENISNVILRI